MKEYKCDVAVVGSGAAGLAAAVAARKNGAENVFVLERDNILGGILPQCIHTGFGVEIFKEDLTGPEYIDRYIKEAVGLGITQKLNTMVLEITPEREVYAASADEGLIKVNAGAVILSMGCRERARGSLCIPGTRPAGVFTVGLTQRFVNIEGYMPGEKVVILGSGDVGLIMARRLTFEGASVEAVVELMPHLGGLIRNKVQCLDDYDIPLYLSHTVTKITGNKRLTSVTIAEVDENGDPKTETERVIECDTLLLSVGLIPENELTEQMGAQLDPITGGPIVDNALQTTMPGVFACGNVVHVCDLVDNVTRMGLVAGANAAGFVAEGDSEKGPQIKLVPGDNVRYVVPQIINKSSFVKESVDIHLRVLEPGIDKKLLIMAGDEEIFNSRKRAVHPGEALIADLSKSTNYLMKDIDKLTVSVV